MIGQQIHQQGNERCFEDKASHLIFPWGNLKAENHDVKSLESKKKRKRQTDSAPKGEIIEIY